MTSSSWAFAVWLLLCAGSSLGARVQQPSPTAEGRASSPETTASSNGELVGNASKTRPRSPLVNTPQVASASGRHTTILLEAGIDKPFQVVRRPTKRIVDVKFFPDGERIATADYSGGVVIWNATSGEALRDLQGHDEGVELHQVEIFPQGDRMVSIAHDAQAIIWSAATGKALHRLKGTSPAEAHRAVRVYPDGKRIVTGVSNSTEAGAIIWDTATGKELHRIVQPTGEVRFIELSPDGGKLVTAGKRSAWMWDAATGEKIRGPLGGHSDWITGVAFADNGSKLVTCSVDGRLIVWEVNTGKRKMMKVPGSLNGVVASATSDRMITFGRPHTAVWNMTTGRFVSELDHVGDIQRMALSPGGGIVAGCHSLPWSSTGRTAIWDAATGRLLSFVRDVDDVENDTSTLPPMPCTVTMGKPRLPLLVAA